jgi:hypothetical protein
MISLKRVNDRYIVYDDDYIVIVTTYRNIAEEMMARRIQARENNGSK